MSGSDDLQELIEAVLSILLPLKEGEFTEKLNKISVYIVTIGKSFSAYDSAIESIRQQSASDQDKFCKEVANRTAALKASIGGSIRFARMNLDLAMVQALDKLVRRPKSANKVDESKRKQSLGEWFDQLTDPAPAMLEHFKASSNPLDKWLVAGQWGHEYLRKRCIDSEAYDRNLCELIPCSDHVATRIILDYGKLNRAIDVVEERSLKTLDALKTPFVT
jgi:hypothetical protein